MDRFNQTFEIQFFYFSNEKNITIYNIWEKTMAVHIYTEIIIYKYNKIRVLSNIHRYERI